MTLTNLSKHSLTYDEAKELVGKELQGLVERFTQKGEAALLLSETVGLTWSTVGNTVVNEHGVDVAVCATETAAQVITLYSPEKILTASQAKKQIAENILSLFNEGEYNHVLINGFTAATLIEEYKGWEAATDFMNALQQFN